MKYYQNMYNNYFLIPLSLWPCALFNKGGVERLGVGFDARLPLDVKINERGSIRYVDV